MNVCRNACMHICMYACMHVCMNTCIYNIYECTYVLYFITYNAYLFFQQILNIIYNVLHSTQNPRSKSIPLKIINFRLKQKFIIQICLNRDFYKTYTMHVYLICDGIEYVGLCIGTHALG